jgi:outer membrane protein assembly factor BamA
MRAGALAGLLAGLSLTASAQNQGFWPVIGGLPFDSGIALGVEYRHRALAGGHADFRARAIGSVRKYEHGEAWLSFPRLAGGWLFAEMSTRYRNYPEENFWGLGPNSEKSHRTNFRHEDFQYAASVGLRPKRWARVGVTGGRTRANTGPGKKRDWPSTERLFEPAQIPALDHQPDYFQAGVFARVDYRNHEHNPSFGGNYEARLTYHGDRDFDRFSFRRYEVELQQFFPVFETPAVIAFRGLASLIDTSPGQHVPFFMQDTVGGGNNLRGFHQHRFRDENLLVFNLEYRRTLNPYVELVGFGDAGRVFSRRDQFGLGGMEGSVGAGGRLKFRGRVLLGLDVGFSREGIRFWFRGSQIF